MANAKNWIFTYDYSCFGIRVSIKKNGNCKELISCRPILSRENVVMSTKRYTKTKTKSDPDKGKHKQRKFPSFILTVTRFYLWYGLFSFPTSLSCILKLGYIIVHPCPIFQFLVVFQNKTNVWIKRRLYNRYSLAVCLYASKEFLSNKTSKNFWDINKV